ncbi:hypothetical protein ADUPG1_011722 [Aduncisulcus paluster]|uniref:Uncharacterized protein n=1 Tax=Aduncisulcus paluster TaxID=2918883 RepID=A0ABQ5K070_9EUKA|nr:hypothetical protein ADUPG1_011722 [Aduncisulcus paluster]
MLLDLAFPKENTQVPHEPKSHDPITIKLKEGEVLSIATPCFRKRVFSELAFQKRLSKQGKLGEKYPTDSGSVKSHVILPLPNYHPRSIDFLNRDIVIMSCGEFATEKFNGALLFYHLKNRHLVELRHYFGGARHIKIFKCGFKQLLVAAFSDGKVRIVQIPSEINLSKDEVTRRLKEISKGDIAPEKEDDLASPKLPPFCHTLSRPYLLSPRYIRDSSGILDQPSDSSGKEEEATSIDLDVIFEVAEDGIFFTSADAFTQSDGVILLVAGTVCGKLYIWSVDASSFIEDKREKEEDDEEEEEEKEHKDKDQPSSCISSPLSGMLVDVQCGFDCVYDLCMLNHASSVPRTPVHPVQRFIHRGLCCVMSLNGVRCVDLTTGRYLIGGERQWMTSRCVCPVYQSLLWESRGSDGRGRPKKKKEVVKSVSETKYTLLHPTFLSSSDTDTDPRSISGYISGSDYGSVYFRAISGLCSPSPCIEEDVSSILSSEDSDTDTDPRSISGYISGSDYGSVYFRAISGLCSPSPCIEEDVSSILSSEELAKVSKPQSIVPSISNIKDVLGCYPIAASAATSPILSVAHRDGIVVSGNGSGGVIVCLQAFLTRDKTTSRNRAKGLAMKVVGASSRICQLMQFTLPLQKKLTSAVSSSAQSGTVSDDSQLKSDAHHPVRTSNSSVSLVPSIRTTSSPHEDMNEGVAVNGVCVETYSGGCIVGAICSAQNILMSVRVSGRHVVDDDERGFEKMGYATEYDGLGGGMLMYDDDERRRREDAALEYALHRELTDTTPDELNVEMMDSSQLAYDQDMLLEEDDEETLTVVEFSAASRPESRVMRRGKRASSSLGDVSGSVRQPSDQMDVSDL